MNWNVYHNLLNLCGNTRFGAIRILGPVHQIPISSWTIVISIEFNLSVKMALSWSVSCNKSYSIDLHIYTGCSQKGGSVRHPLVVLGHIIEKKSWKIASSKIVKFQGSLKLAHFLMIEIWGLPSLSSFFLGISPSI